MAYLLTQILFCVLFAAVAGGAIAWLLQNRRFSKREDEFRVSLDRHAQALSRSRSETKMVLGDFDDLKANSEAHIAELQHETARIPQLNENLEKSQTLVRQMLQKHDAELHAVNSDNERLQSKLATLELRERDAESEITALRKKIAFLDTADAGETDPGQDSDVESDELSAAPESPLAAHPAATGDDVLTLTAGMEQFDGDDSDDNVGNYDVPPASVVSVHAPQRDVATADRTATGVASSALAASAAIPPEEAVVSIADTVDEALLAEALPDSAAGIDGDSRVPVASIESSPALLDADLLDEDDLMNRTWLGDGTEELAHDDLQSIHGIGPLMERSLNDIGITSYHQIARLTCGEIEQIAEILEIFPGRIERDDWVGNARRLASEELEEA